METPYEMKIPLLVDENYYRKDLSTHMDTTTLSTIALSWNQPSMMNE